MTGSSFALSMIVHEEALVLEAGTPAEFECTLSDGRTKGSLHCSNCMTKLWGRSRNPGLAILDPGTLDDTSWLRPVGHIWLQSAQPWMRFDDEALRFDRAPDPEGMQSLVRGWKSRPPAE